MKRLALVLGVGVIAAFSAAACGGGNQETPATEGTPAVQTPAAPAGDEQVNITFTSQPDPPMTGENTFEVMVMQDGQPVTDADVSVTFFMAAMPQMPEMRNTVPLTHEGGGRYRGTGNVMMAGGWEVTVTATRGGQEIATRTFGVQAK